MSLFSSENMTALRLYGGWLLDPSQDLNRVGDVFLRNGRIVGMDSAPDKGEFLSVDCTGCLITPGQADIHAHVGKADTSELSVLPDEAGVHRGVTLLGDAGTAGAKTFDAYLASLGITKTRIRSFLNIHPQGIPHLVPEDWSVPLDFDAAAETVTRHGEHIAGIKLRALSGFVATHGIAGLQKIKAFAEKMRLPLMIHLGTAESDLLPANWENFCMFLPDILGAGDILSHCHTGKPGGLITPDKRFYPRLRAAVERGVLLDAAIGLFNFDARVARQALEDEFRPHCISTDLIARSTTRGVFDLALTMSRFLALGLSLEGVVRCVTVNAYAALGVPFSGLVPGEPANLTILEMREGPVCFEEMGGSQQGSLLLVPKAVVLGENMIASYQRPEEYRNAIKQ